MGVRRILRGPGARARSGVPPAPDSAPSLRAQALRAICGVAQAGQAPSLALAWAPGSSSRSACARPPAVFQQPVNRSSLPGFFENHPVYRRGQPATPRPVPRGGANPVASVAARGGVHRGAARGTASGSRARRNRQVVAKPLESAGTQHRGAGLAADRAAGRAPARASGQAGSLAPRLQRRMRPDNRLLKYRSGPPWGISTA